VLSFVPDDRCSHATVVDLHQADRSSSNPWRRHAEIIGERSRRAHRANSGRRRAQRPCARLAWLAGLRGQPLGPFRPPRSFDKGHSLQPFVRPDIGCIGLLSVNLIRMDLLARRRHDTGVAATAGQKERNVGVHLVMYLVNGLPGRHVITHCADHEHRRVNIRQRDRLAFDEIAALGEIGVEEQLAQIFGIHPVWQARGVGVPGHQIAGQRAFSHKVVACDPRPD
jgi:hypothetical protein